MSTLADVLHRFGGRLWTAPAYLDYVQPPLTDAALAAAERRLSVRLPAAYVALLRDQNGGYIRGSWPDQVGDTLYGIGPQFPNLLDEQPDWEEDWAPPGADHLIAFDGDGHWHLCLDYRRCDADGEPGVTFVDRECRSEAPLADSFSAFLAGLRDTAQADLRLYDDLDGPAFAARLAPHFGPTTEDGGFNHGYPVFAFRLPGDERVWLRPNVVPAGFRRRDRRVETEGPTVLRLPEDPACRASLAHTEGAGATVEAALEAAGLRWRRPLA